MSMYLWLKALHVISMMSWMAGLLYLPRLMVYHCAAAAGSEQSETFKVMERRLLKAIMTPAMIASWGFGLATVWAAGVDYLFGTIWFWLKLALVVGLSAVHLMLAGHVRRFAEDRNEKPGHYFRIINEVPTVIMIAVVILVVVKPF